MKRFTPASRLFVTTVLALAVPQIVSPQARANGFQSNDLLKLRSVTAVQLSPDGTRAAYVVDNNDGPGRPYGQLWVMTLADGKSVRFGAEKESSDDPQWSPDGQWIAYRGRIDGKSGLVVAKPDGSGARLLAEVTGNERAAARQQHQPGLVAGRQADRVRQRRAGTGNRRRERRSDGDHAVSLQARRGRRDDALQRQPPAASLRR